MIWLVVVVVAYLLGSVSSSYLLMRGLRGIDIRRFGSGNAGATNVLRTAGLLPGLAVLLLDIGKGAAAVLAARSLAAPGSVVGATAVAAVVGHIFPVFHGFRGGKGVATATGALAGLAPLAALLGAVAFALLVVTTRYVALGSIGAVALFPAFAWLAGVAGWSAPAPSWLLLASLAVAALIVAKHVENIVRIRAGEEWRLGDPHGEEEIGR